MFLAYSGLAEAGSEAARLELPITVTPLITTVLPSSEPSTLPPAEEAISTTTAPAGMAESMALVINRGAGSPGISAVVTAKLVLASCSATASCCFCLYSAEVSRA